MKLSDLVNAIESLDIKKSTAQDGLSPRILKRAAKVISPTLLVMINISIYTGNLKIAKLILIHKGGAKYDPSNYRPISILSVLSKLLEKHVAKYLFAYLNLLHKSQSGFRKHHSCNTALINMVDKWLNSIDKGEVVGQIFYNLKKVFYIVNHELLIKNLDIYKDTITLNWMNSYLSDRKQGIISKQDQSSLHSVKAVVRQQSVLGPFCERLTFVYQ